MCSINFTIEYEDVDTGVVFDQEGQFRLQNTTEWIPFLLDLNNPQTPNLDVEGVYEMRVRIFDGRVWSDWFYTYFSIGCGAFTIGFSTGFNA